MPQSLETQETDRYLCFNCEADNTAAVRAACQEVFVPRAIDVSASASPTAHDDWVFVRCGKCGEFNKFACKDC